MADTDQDKGAALPASFEEALAELEGIVRRLESGQVSLEQSIEEYTRGAALKRHCMNKLEEARMKVERITRDADGNLATTPFEGAE
jgi:exodeoxyribonuclease VII small subunit